MAAQGQERRQYGRIDLDPPLRGNLDEFPVRVIQVSVSGLRVEHEVRVMPAPRRRLRVLWDIETLEFDCVLARTTLHRLARTAAEKTIYHSGIKILEPIGDSEKLLRDLIAERVIHALEEQKANARGVPPLKDYTYQVEKGDRFRRCELMGGAWRRTETTERLQPAGGFTVSAEVDPAHVEMLCKTFEQTTEEGRRLTQILAELSISKSEGTPTRRYVP